MPDERRLVYSTDGSMPLPKFEDERKRAQPKRSAGIPDDGTVRVGCERRRGGSVTMVHGLGAAELVQIASDLKRKCGTGGTVKDGIVELQGDRRDAVLAYFASGGRKAKRMGG